MSNHILFYVISGGKTLKRGKGELTTSYRATVLHSDAPCGELTWLRAGLHSQRHRIEGSQGALEEESIQESEGQYDEMKMGSSSILHLRNGWTDYICYF